MFKIGLVDVYYEKISTAIIRVISLITVGDIVVFVKDGKTLFEEKVELIQIGHKKVDFASSGDVIGLKTHEKVEKGTEVFKKSL